MEKAISNFAKLEGKDVGIAELDLVLVFDTGVLSTNVNHASALGRSAATPSHNMKTNM